MDIRNPRAKGNISHQEVDMWLAHLESVKSVNLSDEYDM
jgi:hypothetical protein